MVRDCVVARTAAERSTLDDVDPAEESTWDPVADVVAGCRHDVVAAPQFAEEQQRAAGGALAEDQLACLRDGYSELGSVVATEAAGEAVSAEATGSALDLIDQLVEDCDVG